MYHLRQSTTAIIVANQMQQWVLCSLLHYTSLSKTEQYSVFENNTFMANICHREQKKAYLILHVNCPIVMTFGFSQQIFIKVRTDGRTDLWTHRQEDGRTDMATLIALILDYKKAPKTGFIERTVLICDVELALSATFNTTGPTKTCRLLLT